MKTKKVRINRKKWLRGNRNGKGECSDSMLLNKDGDRCCLGFSICQIGKIKKDRLLNIEYPGSLDFVVSPFNRNRNKIDCILNESNWNFNEDTDFSCRCAKINDDRHISDDVREHCLRKKFASKGIELEFYN